MHLFVRNGLLTLFGTCVMRISRTKRFFKIKVNSTVVHSECWQSDDDEHFYWLHQELCRQKIYVQAKVWMGGHVKTESVVSIWICILNIFARLLNIQKKKPQKHSHVSTESFFFHIFREISLVEKSNI